MFKRLATDNTAADSDPASLAAYAAGLLLKALPSKLPSNAKITWKPTDARPMRSGRGVTFNLPVAKAFGIFDAIIESAYLRVEASELEDAKHGTLFHVRVSLSYDHPGGGSNGFSIGTFYFQKGGKVLEFQKNR